MPFPSEWTDTFQPHPFNIRADAAERWGVDNGIVSSPGSRSADWHRLQDLGLIGP
ncbi:hypothetical protein [Actinopolymorpha rutila]|uniref:Uncharacterized protein n=1 Tax=Actinopolymorpha rutila TaxID=446787 RepID=A0A852ZU31_9ACTN|nr:hypothetical protein [Actinopolymorpha rutila]NYH92839.1 hypothetical protein [Actinopolymorpha rutila]